MDLANAKELTKALYKLDTRIDTVQQTESGALIYISVPAHSSNVDSDGNELSGEYLAKKIQSVIDEFYGCRMMTVKYKIIG